MAKVFIIILNWNGLENTLECLDSVFRLDYPDFRAVVVDNCSSDNSAAVLRSAFPGVVVLENSENLGYTGGNNVGIRHALAQGADYLWLLNNDTVVEPDSLGKLVQEAEENPEVGLVSPAIHYYDAPERHQFIGAYAEPRWYNVAKVREPGELGEPRVRENLVLWGTALLVRRSVVEAIGGLSEGYFAYHEDADYSLRALRRGFRTRMRLDARILHKDSQTTGKRSPLQVFLRTRNLYFLWRDNEERPRRTRLVRYYLAMVLYNAHLLLEEGNPRGFEACLNGFWAALTGRRGAYDPSIAIPWPLRMLLAGLASGRHEFWMDLVKLNLRGVARRLAPFVRAGAETA